MKEKQTSFQIEIEYSCLTPIYNDNIFKNEINYNSLLKLKERFKNYSLTNEEKHDILISMDDGNLTVQSLFLCGLSKKIKKIIDKKKPIDGKYYLNFKKCKSEIMQYMIKYLYTGFININVLNNNFMDAMNCVSILEIPCLFHLLETFLQENIRQYNYDKLIDILKNSKNKCNRLHDILKDYICVQFNISSDETDENIINNIILTKGYYKSFNLF
jgi:hypothetical protein